MTDVTFLVNRIPRLVGFGGFERNESSANSASDTWVRLVSGGACHDMVLLADYGCNRQKRERKWKLQFGDQSMGAHANPVPAES